MEKKNIFNIFTALIYTFCEIKEEEGTNLHSVLFDELVFQYWIPFLTLSPGHRANLWLLHVPSDLHTKLVVTFYLNDGSQGKKIIQKTDDCVCHKTIDLPFLSQSHWVGFSLHLWIRAAFWAARLRTGMSCQIFDSSWGRKWELQKRRRRKIQLCIIYKASGTISLKYGIFSPYWLIPSLDFRKWISSL